MYRDLLTRFLSKPQDPRESRASCRKYERVSAAVTPDTISLVIPMTAFADILTCVAFFHVGAAARLIVSEEAIGREGANRRRSSRLFELSLAQLG